MRPVKLENIRRLPLWLILATGIAVTAGFTTAAQSPRVEDGTVPEEVQASATEPLVMPSLDQVLYSVAETATRDAALLALLAIERLNATTLNQPPTIDDALAAVEDADAAVTSLDSNDGNAQPDQETEISAPSLPDPRVAAARADWVWLNSIAQIADTSVDWAQHADLIALLFRRELAQHQLPLWSNESVAMQNLTRQAEVSVFSRGNTSLAATLLKPVLSGAEGRAAAIWNQFEENLAENTALGDAALAELPAEFWQTLGAGKSVPEEFSERANLARMREAFSALLVVAGQVDVVDGVEAQSEVILTLAHLRFRLLRALATAEEPADRAAYEALLELSRALADLEENRYLQFADQVLGIADCIINEWASTPGPCVSELYPVLTAGLQVATTGLARPMAEVDTRVSATLTDVVSILEAGPEGDLDALQIEITNARASLLLLVPDAGYYFEQPVRQNVREEIDICTSIAAAAVGGEGLGISKDQFDGCIDSFLRLGRLDASRPALAGDFSGPFEADQLRRELVLPPWQRINYTLGYVHDQHAMGCVDDSMQLVNPLEWAMLAHVIRWFADRWPLYFQSSENEDQLRLMLETGEQFMQSLDEHRGCFAGRGPGGDIVLTLLNDYEREVDRLLQDAVSVQDAFRAERLETGADVDLNGDATQLTRYRPEELSIGPCSEESICEMRGTLTANRGLVDLFPSPYLIADQTRMGSIEICYDDVQWVSRRSRQARDNDDQVANYFGQLSFAIKGQFRSGEEVQEVFTKRLTSPSEYHYLFAANVPEVLDDECPVEYVGTSVNAVLRNSALPIVPTRLTYLSAARMLPTRLFEENWESGEEWQDWFVSGFGVETELELDGSNLSDAVNGHLLSLKSDLERSVYGSLLAQPLRIDGEAQISLAEQVSDVTRAKSLLRAILAIHYPNQFRYNDRLRAQFEGNQSALDYQALRRLRDAEVPLEQINDVIRGRLSRLQQVWLEVPEAARQAGTVDPVVAMAWLQLKELQQRFFEVPALVEPEEVIEEASESPVASTNPSDSIPAGAVSSSVPPGSGQPNTPSPE